MRVAMNTEHQVGWLDQGQVNPRIHTYLKSHSSFSSLSSSNFLTKGCHVVDVLGGLVTAVSFLFFLLD